MCTRCTAGQPVYCSARFFDVLHYILSTLYTTLQISFHVAVTDFFVSMVYLGFYMVILDTILSCEFKNRLTACTINCISELFALGDD